MELWIGIVLVNLVLTAVRAIRNRTSEPKPQSMCTGCLHAHVQYGANGKRAISCTYAGAVRLVKLDVLYCTDYQARNVPLPARAIGFARQVAPLE